MPSSSGPPTFPASVHIYVAYELRQTLNKRMRVCELLSGTWPADVQVLALCVSLVPVAASLRQIAAGR